MFKNYLTISLRYISRHKGFAIINIAGLTLGVTTTLIILLIVRFELSFDTFHTKADRIYRVIKVQPDDRRDTGTPHGLMTVLETEFPEIEKVDVAYKLNPDETQLEVNQQLSREPNIYFITPSFFQMFNFQWMVGSPETSLSQPGQVVIDENLAQKYFQGDALGKSIKVNNQYDLVVSGIIQNNPENTDFPIQMAISHATFAATDHYDKELNINTESFYQTYVLLSGHADLAALEAKFPTMIAKYLGKEVAEKWFLGLQPLQDIHFNEQTESGNFTKRAISKETLRSISFIGILILITACINFVNLATAQAVNRAKEVGIRKVLGSTRIQLIRQFLSETLLLCFMASLFSLLITILFLSRFATYLSITIDEGMVFQPKVLVALLIICATTSLVSGFYPSILLSKYKPVTSLKKSFTNRGVDGLLLRKGLVIFQFVITFLLITGTIVVVSQLLYLRTKSLGFDQHAVITVDVPSHTPAQLSTLRNSLLQYASIKDISFSSSTPSASVNSWTGFLHHSDPNEWKDIEHKAIDENYLDLFDIKLLAGRNIDPNDSSVEVIINETFMHEIGIQDPEAALSETISFWGMNNVPIIGVVQDFNTVSLHRFILSCYGKAIMT